MHIPSLCKSPLLKNNTDYVINCHKDKPGRITAQFIQDEVKYFYQVGSFFGEHRYFLNIFFDNSKIQFIHYNSIQVVKNTSYAFEDFHDFLHWFSYLNDQLDERIIQNINDKLCLLRFEQKFLKERINLFVKNYQTFKKTNGMSLDKDVESYKDFGFFE